MNKRLKLQNVNLVPLLLSMVCSVLLTACEDTGGQKSYSDPNTLIYANLSEDGVDREAVDEFNRTHTDVQIEIKDYSDEDGHSGRERLLVEIAAGVVPDIIDLGSSFNVSLSYRQLVQKGYLEDLWPYIENDPELDREALLEAPLKAAEVDGGLYLAFHSVLINTLIGAERIVGDRTSWTLEDLREAFASMPEGSMVLTYYFDKSEIFDYILCMSLDSYVDWEKGECDFDSEQFRSDLEFINSFPEEVSWASDEALTEKISEQMLSGRQMLIQDWICYPTDVQYWDFEFGDRTSFVGYPVTDGSVGSSFCIHGCRLAMSSACQNKGAAWDFLRQMFLPRYNAATISDLYNPNHICIPINRADYELKKRMDMDMNMPENREIVIDFAGRQYEYHAVTEEEWHRYNDFVNSIDKIELYDYTVLSIVKDACGPYFAGDKTLDETVDLIQNRVSLYVNENR